MPKGAASRGKRPDKRPARGNYWMRGTLRKRKVKHLMHSNCMDQGTAEAHWSKVRKGRMG